MAVALDISQIGDSLVDGSEREQFRGYPVKVAIFEGPLDLLLHLVKRQDLDIHEVSLAAITDQYLQYITAMEALSIELAGEFLVVAASLLLIKSRSLLPATRSEGEEDEEDPAVIEAKLQQRLAEYRTYKEAALALDESRRARQRIFLRPSGVEDGIIGGLVPLGDVSVFDMISALNGMLQRARPDRPARLQRPVVSIGERVEQIRALLANASGPLAFGDVVDVPESRLHIIVSFLAVLELIRRQVVRVSLLAGGNGTPGPERIVIGLAEGVG
jgi:segregation and condensation protein A